MKIYSLFNPLFSTLPVVRRKIVFNNFNGGGYGCNSKYIAETLLRREDFDTFDVAWMVKSDVEAGSLPKRIRPIKVKSFKARYEIATANVIISNVRIGLFTEGLKKKNNQLYVQTWHGGLGFKKIESDANCLSERYLKMAVKDSKMMDVLLSAGKWQTEYFKKCFFYSGKILEIGLPRNDIFFVRDNVSLVRDVKKRLGINEREKFFIYVPTFRDAGHERYDKIDFRAIEIELRKKFSGDWKGVVRYHPNAKPEQKVVGNVIDASMYPDVQELLYVADVLITDYSSAAFDFALSRKPVFIFAPDAKEYDLDRGFLFNLSEMPFPIGFDNEELLGRIQKFNEEEYLCAVENFYNSHGIVRDGNSSEKCVSHILEELSKIS